MPKSRMRRSILGCFLFASLAAAVIAASTMLVDSEKRSPAPESNPKSSEDLIEAVMFNTGPMVGEIDALDDDVADTLTPQQYVEFRSFARGVIDDAIAKDPEVIYTASNDLRSGNPKRVDRAINQLRIELTEASDRELASLGLEQHLSTANGSNGYGAIVCGAVVACVFYIALAAHNTAAVSVFFAGSFGFILWAAVWFWSDDGADGSAAIDRDRLVAQLALELKS